jgi:hypothetical protein
LDWVKSDPLQPEPITLAIWMELPEDFCRQVEVVDGQAIRCASPTRTRQRVARAIAEPSSDRLDAPVRIDLDWQSLRLA